MTLLDKLTFSIAGMGCMECVAAIENAVMSLTSVTGGVAVVAGPEGIVAVLLAAFAGLWAWPRGRARRQQT